jgi:putative ABC transport system substrate-binding protein
VLPLRPLIAAAAAAVALLVAGPRASADPRPRVVVLRGEAAAPHVEAAAGVRERLEAHRTPPAVDVRAIDGDPARLAGALEELRTDSPSVVIPLGTLATTEALRKLSGPPVVAGMILDSRPVSGRPNATAVTLEFPLEVELEWMHRFFPELREVGVLYDPGVNGARIEAARSLAGRRGLRLVPNEVRTPRELPRALESLARRIDVLWGVADPTVLSPETAKSILLFSYENRIPFTGLSDAWARAGAVYALERDYADIGRQCGDLALRILAGESVASLAPQPPRRVLYSINLKAVRHMKLQLPRELVENAHRTFE